MTTKRSCKNCGDKFHPKLPNHIPPQVFCNAYCCRLYHDRRVKHRDRELVRIIRNSTLSEALAYVTSFKTPRRK